MEKKALSFPTAPVTTWYRTRESSWMEGGPRSRRATQGPRIFVQAPRHLVKVRTIRSGLFPTAIMRFRMLAPQSRNSIRASTTTEWTGDYRSA